VLHTVLLLISTNIHANLHSVGCSSSFTWTLGMLDSLPYPQHVDLPYHTLILASSMLGSVTIKLNYQRKKVVAGENHLCTKRHIM